MFAFPSGNAWRREQKGSKEKAVGYEGGDSDEGGEKSHLALTSKGKGTGPKRAVLDPLSIWASYGRRMQAIISVFISCYVY